MFTIIIQEKGGEQRRMVFNKPEVTIGRVQIDARMSRARWREQMDGIGKELLELLDHFGTHFVTAGIRGRANRDPQVFGTGAVFVFKLLDGS